MLQLLYPDAPEADFVEETAAFLEGTPHPALAPTVVFVAERPGSSQLVGFLELSLRNYAEGCTGNSVPYVESWYVDEDFRGSGVGKALMQAAEDWSRAQGYKELASDTWHDNAASVKAHQALGFEVVEQNICFRKAL